ncbi:reverse transcriptase domain-containing protein [Tanacetum coccineum]
MSTRSSARRLLSPVEDPKKLISRRNQSEPSLLFDLEEDDMAGQAPPQGLIPDLRSMEELLQAPTDGVGDAIVIDTFYNNLNQSEQDSLNSAANGNFLTKNTQEDLTIIENKSKVQTSRNKPQVASDSGSSDQDAHITSLTKQVEALLSLHRSVNSVQNGCETCGGPHPYYECQAASGYTEDVYATTGTYNQGGNSHQPQVLHERPPGALPSNTKPNPREKVNSFMTRSGLTTAGPSIPTLVLPTPTVAVEKEPETLMDEVHITILESTAHVPPLGVPEKLDDPEKFLISCILQEREVYNSLANSGASINLMPFSIYEKLGIDPLKPTRMTLELANRSVTFSMGIAEDVIVKVEKFNFLVDFVIVDFEADPRVPIILGRPSLRTIRVLVDLYKEKLTLRVRNEEVVFYTNKSSRNNSRDMQSVHCINIIDFSKYKTSSGNTTPSDSVVESPSPSPIPYEDSDSLVKETDTLLSHFNDSSPDYETFCFDIEKKSSGNDHIEEKSSGSTTTHSDVSLFEYDSFIFYPSIDPLPPVDKSDFYHEEFTNELAHIISPPEHDHFYLDIEPDPGVLTRLLKENISETSPKDLRCHELNDSSLLLSDCDSSLSKEFFKIDLLVSFPSGNEDIIFDPEIFIIKGVQSKRLYILPLDVFSTISFDPPEIETFLSFPARNEDKVFDPGIFFINRVFSFTRKSPYLLIDNFMIDKYREDTCLFSILQSSGLRSSAYFGILNPDHVYLLKIREILRWSASLDFQLNECSVTKSALNKVWKSGSIRRIQVLDTAYWGFLGLGTTLDIFNNNFIDYYLDTGVLSPYYGVLIFIPHLGVVLWGVQAEFAVSSLDGFWMVGISE